jgi:hypothetical protein
MRALRMFAAPFLIAVSFAGCTGETVVQSGCEKHNTALIMFQNLTPDTTFDAFVDSTALGSIAPGEVISRDVSAGRTHTLRCCLTTAGDSCTSRTDTFPECSQTTFDCVVPPPRIASCRPDDPGFRRPRAAARTRHGLLGVGVRSSTPRENS